MESLASFLTQHAYWGLSAGIAAESLGIPLPGEILILLAVAMAPQAQLSLIGIVSVTVIAAMTGDHGSYVIGRSGGSRLVNIYCRATFCSRDCGNIVTRFFQRFGGWTLVLSRFIPGLRAFAIPFAGMTRMSYWKFLIADLMGVILWATMIVSLGAAFGRALTDIVHQILHFGSVGVLLLVFVLAVTNIWRIRKVRREGILMLDPDAPMHDRPSKVDSAKNIKERFLPRTAALRNKRQSENIQK